MPGRVYGVPGSCLSATAAALSLLLVLVAVSLPAADGVDATTVATTTSAPGVSGSASIVTSTAPVIKPAVTAAPVIKPAVTAAPTSAAARSPALERPMLSAVLVGATIAAGLAVLVS